MLRKDWPVALFTFMQPFCFRHNLLKNIFKRKLDIFKYLFGSFAVYTHSFQCKIFPLCVASGGTLCLCYLMRTPVFPPLLPSLHTSSAASRVSFVSFSEWTTQLLC